VQTDPNSYCKGDWAGHKAEMLDKNFCHAANQNQIRR